MNNKIHLTLTARFPVTALQPTDRALAIAALFGLPLGHDSHITLFENEPLTLSPGDLLLITGPSGAGKSTLLKKITAALAAHTNLTLFHLHQVPLPADRPLLDCFPAPLEETLAHLSRAGLSEAHDLLRAPAHLSEGQQFRYRLAQFFASSADLLLADEFCATLDRVTAKVVAHQLGKFIRTSRRIAIVATTHEDLHQDLAPTQRLYKPLAPGIERIPIVKINPQNDPKIHLCTAPNLV